MSKRGVPELSRVLGMVPSGVYVLSAAFDGLRAGLLVQWVQQMGFEPPMLTVAVPKGQPIAPMIRDSHAFGLNQLAKGDHFLDRKFLAGAAPMADPFVAIETITLGTGAPIITRAMAALDCRVIRHLDFETDHEFFVGEVLAAKLFEPEARPMIRLRDDGMVH